MFSLDKFFSKNTVVGVEISPEKINVTQISKKGVQYKLVKYYSEEIPEGIFQDGKIGDAPALAKILEAVLAKGKIKAKRAATAVPMKDAIIRIIPIAAELDDSEARDLILNHEAALYLPYPREEVDIDYQKLDRFIDEDGIEKVRVLLVATKKDVTDAYTKTFEEAGLQLDVLEINSFALIRAIREQLRQFSSQEAAVLVDMEFDYTEIAIIVDGVPQFSRTVPIGIFHLHKALSQGIQAPSSAKKTEMVQEITIPNTSNVDTTGTGQTWINPGMAALLRVLGELTEELRRSINFYVNQANEVEVAQLLLAGPGSAIGQLDEYFTQKLSLATIRVDPIAALPLVVEQDISAVERAGLGTVIGLGMRSL